MKTEKVSSPEDKHMKSKRNTRGKVLILRAIADLIGWKEDMVPLCVLLVV